MFFHRWQKTTGGEKMFFCLGEKQMIKVLALEICICAALLFSKHGYFLGSLCGYSSSWVPRLTPPISTSACRRLLRDAWLELWATGPLGHWTSESSTSAHWMEKEWAAFAALSILGPSSPHHTLPLAQYLRRAFKCSLKGGEKKQKGKKSETVLFLALNSMALASLTSHDTTLWLSSQFLGVSLHFFFISFPSFFLFSLFCFNFQC